MSDLCTSILEREIQHIKQIFVKAAAGSRVLDVAFIGNSSELYAWEPTPIVDLDVCLFVTERNPKLGRWLGDVRQSLMERMRARCLDFDLRLIRGPYKQTLVDVERPVIVVHLSVFTDELYVERPELMRWAWRKYPCVVETTRLKRLAPEKPTLHELLHGRSGVLKRLKCVESGIAPFIEFTLPDFNEIKWTVELGHPLFAEFCLAAGATCARNHARVLEKPEPDRLANHDFTLWYNSNILKSRPFRSLMELKEKVRNEGYATALFSAPQLAHAYLHELCICIEGQL